MNEFLVVLDIDGDDLPETGSVANEELREAIWDAIDEIGTIYAADENEGTHGPYTVICRGVGVPGRMRS